MDSPEASERGTSSNVYRQFLCTRKGSQRLFRKNFHLSYNLLKKCKISSLVRPICLASNALS